MEDFYTTIRSADEFRNKQTQKMTQNYNNMISELKFAMMEFDGDKVFPEKMSRASYHWRDFLNPSNIIAKRIINKKFQSLNKKEADYVARIEKDLPAENSWGIMENLIICLISIKQLVL